jgi:hypothetical protein
LIKPNHSVQLAALNGKLLHATLKRDTFLLKYQILSLFYCRCYLYLFFDLAVLLISIVAENVGLES